MFCLLFDIFFSLGVLVYVFYGYSHSVEGVRPDERSETQFILSETPDFGKELEEYPAGVATSPGNWRIQLVIKLIINIIYEMLIIYEIYEMLFIRKKKPSLNTQSDSIRAKLFV